MGNSRSKSLTKGGTKNWRKNSKSKKSGKYAMQFFRTAANKARKLAKYRRFHPNWSPGV